MDDRVTPDEPLPTRTEAGEETVDVPQGLGFFTTGQVLGGRYEILEMLGRGGMGEVWRAFDLKLRVEVGLKALREELFQNEGRREMLRQEVRAAREVVSPNVCRIFDLIEIDGRELVSMEYVDGATLLGVLQERGPLELKEAQDIASQFLAGLEAIHKAGLVHRDVKPENIMLTRAGRVVVMDFGLARGPESGAGSVSGTPAYMAPEHAAGQDVDARADVYSAGVVLAEMVSPEGIKSYESRQSVWEGVRSEPAQVPDSPWAPVIQRAVARDRERRQNSAHTLIRELEDVTLRVEGADDLHPYPGLASFTEEDAEYFFGREAEVERMWRKLAGPPRLVGIMGPSGAGKTSFIRAGLIPNAPSGWKILRCTPGNAAIASLRSTLTPELTERPELLQALMAEPDKLDVIVDAIVGWRDGHAGALIIVDQFEELFTLSAKEDQRRFSSLLGRLPLEADVHVVASMRDDFAADCNTHEALQPIFHELTVLNPPTGGSLRRALVQPATKCGYRFEDDQLVEEILAEVEGERGALPLLAFALARLWEKRDRETGLLTRQAYHDIGGVGGALARHAEATVDRIGVERIPVVRELFRNLVTAEGTRAVREWDELLSVFNQPCHPERSGLRGRGVEGSPEGRRRADALNVSPNLRGCCLRRSSSSKEQLDSLADSVAQDDRKGEASDVLSELIDARLLTSYEIREDEHEPVRRVEIIHESLLANWPRLVRWQTQDADAVQMREQLRQAAKTWDEHDRTDDMLWTGSAYRQFSVWREDYPGGLTEVEEEFSTAMTSLAARRKRRQRIAGTTILAVAIVVASVTLALWRRSVRNEHRAEAQQLLAIGKAEIAGHPTAALAFATRSLEISDHMEARLVALEALWQGPAAMVVNEDPSFAASFSPDGKWLIQTHDHSASLAVISSNGRQTILDHPSETGTPRVSAKFGGRSDVFLSWGGVSDEGRVALWSSIEGRMLATARSMTEPTEFFNRVGGTGPSNGRYPAIVAMATDELATVDALHPDGSSDRLGTIPLQASMREELCIPKRSPDWVGIVDGNDVSVVRITRSGLSERIHLGRHEGDLYGYCAAEPLGRHFLTVSRSGGCRIWDPAGEESPLELDSPPGFFVIPSDDWSLLFGVGPSKEPKLSDVLVWSIAADRLELRRRIEGVRINGGCSIDPVGMGFATRGPMPAHRLWSLSEPAAAEPVLLRRGAAGLGYTPLFSPDGRWVATSDQSGLSLWPRAGPRATVVRLAIENWMGGIQFDPDGGFLVVAADSTVTLLPLEGEVPAAEHTVFDIGRDLLTRVEISPSGELFAVGRHGGEVWIGRDDGNPPDLLFESEVLGSRVAGFSHDGRYVAAMTGFYSIASAVYRVWNVDTRDEVAIFDIGEDVFRTYGAGFDGRGRLLTSSSIGVLAWNIDTGDYEVLTDGDVANFTSSLNGRRLVVTEEGKGSFTQDPAGPPVFYDLEAGTRTVLESHGPRVKSMAMNAEGSIVVTGDADGIVRVGLSSGEEPHLLLGHEGWAYTVAIDPKGRWIASGGQDHSIRLWPMPDLSKPPLHTLPREELIAKLKTLTNLRVVRNPESSSGWTLTHDPFPGWETVPTW